MPIAILGMHGVGCTMLGDLLARCGVAPAPVELFVRVNDSILQTFDGAWDLPPQYPALWETEPRLADLGAMVMRRFARTEPWAWADPRTALTLRFWRRLAPDLRVVVCVRHPLTVARSLCARRPDLAPETALLLWELYYRRLLQEVPPDRVVTHFDSWFVAPELELRRLLHGLQLPVIEAALPDALAGLDAHRHVGADVPLLHGPEPLRRLYRRLVAESARPAPSRHRDALPAAGATAAAR